ncbi:MAG: NAD(P)H-dependent flavin oxidoreductase [Granulosicoccaceae bacterium]
MSHTTACRINTKFTDLMGVDHPIVLAPMAGVSGGALAAAVGRAGGLGLIGGGYGDASFIEREFALAAGEQVGVGFITWSLAQKPELLDQALNQKPKAVMLSFGDISPFSAKIKKAGATLLVQVQNLEQAHQAAGLGADIIIAQGTEAGGHGASRATLPLVPAVVDDLQNTPILAAGGIADGRGLAASLTLGASGVLMGSRFYACEESLAPVEAQRTAVQASGDNTIRSSVFDTLRGLDWPAPYNLRSLVNTSTQQWHLQLPALERHLSTEQPKFRQAVDKRDFDIAPVIVGEGVDLIREVKPAQDIVQACIEEAIECLTKPQHYTIGT